jgi:hypothetical protein
LPPVWIEPGTVRVDLLGLYANLWTAGSTGLLPEHIQNYKVYLEEPRTNLQLQSVRTVLKQVAQASDVEGEDTAMWTELRVASRACVLCDIVTAHPRLVSTLASCTVAIGLNTINTKHRILLQNTAL